MPGAAPASRIHPLCYEHHSEMKVREFSLSEDGIAYACQEPNCFVHYCISEGYFLNTQDRRFLIEQGPIPPHQYCSSDSYPMYLLEVQDQHPSHRLWKCPKCSLNYGGGQFT
jgi:hypothetical protein